ncbi:MAG: TRAP transporter small permease [Oscillospiraceae bacterium]
MKKTFDKITTVTDKICYYVSYFSMAVAILMAILLTADVLLRKVTSGVASVKGCYEITQMLLCTFIFSSWAYTQSVHGHIHVVMFIQKMPQKLRFFCYGLTSLLSVATMVFGAYAVYHQIFNVMKSGESTANLMIPYWPFYIFEFVAMVLLAIVLLRDAIKAVIAMFRTDFAEEIQSEWV